LITSKFIASTILYIHEPQCCSGTAISILYVVPLCISLPKQQKNNCSCCCINFATLTQPFIIIPRIICSVFCRQGIINSCNLDLLLYNSSKQRLRSKRYGRKQKYNFALLKCTLSFRMKLKSFMSNSRFNKYWFFYYTREELESLSNHLKPLSMNWIATFTLTEHLEKHEFKIRIKKGILIIIRGGKQYLLKITFH
jgi:hypothetical protein